MSIIIFTIVKSHIDPDYFLFACSFPVYPQKILKALKQTFNMRVINNFFITRFSYQMRQFQFSNTVISYSRPSVLLPVFSGFYLGEVKKYMEIREKVSKY